VTSCTQFRDRLRRAYADVPSLSWCTEQEKAVRDAMLFKHLFGGPASVPEDRTPVVESVLREALYTPPSADSYRYIWWLVKLGAAIGYSAASAPLLIQLLLRLGHGAHEEIVSELDSLQMPLAIPAFVFAAKHRKQLLGDWSDKGDAMARKAVWALGKLRRGDRSCAEAEAALLELSQLKDRKVARYAISMLKRGEC
jgi:hypothetical protein